MKKIMKQVMLCACFCAGCWLWGVIGDRETLNEELIRLHVVAQSDSQEDQAIKLQVRDAVIESLSEDLAKIADVEEARQYIRQQLPKIQQLCNKTENGYILFQKKGG